MTRRDFLQAAGLGALALAQRGPYALNAGGNEHSKDKQTMMVKPTPQQLAWQEAELTMFVHFGINTFTNREWGEGNEDPKLFNPADLDARQWAQAAKEAGFQYVILTAKHHDGFCLWPSRYTEHSVKNSPWRGGKGDVVREFADACHAARLKMGLYLSPWDRHERTYGDSPAYNRYYLSQMTELLTQYGDVAEVWLDGANGEGPNGKKQVYDFAAFKATIRRLQPQAVIFAPIEMTPDIRWIGNENGIAGDPCWSPFDPGDFLERQKELGSDANAGSYLEHGYENGTVWMPGEADVSIRPGWFWHAAEDSRVKSLSHLVDLYFQSVGRNSLLLLNVPPDDRGLFSAPDVRRLQEFRAAREAAFAHDLARGKQATADGAQPGHEAARAVDGQPSTYWRAQEGAAAPSLVVDLGRPTALNVAMTQEQIAEGQRVAAYRIEAQTEQGWQEVAAGTTIGHKKLDRFPAVTATKVRLTLTQSRARPLIRAFGLFNAPRVAAG